MLPGFGITRTALWNIFDCPGAGAGVKGLIRYHEKSLLRPEGNGGDLLYLFTIIRFAWTGFCPLAE